MSADSIGPLPSVRRLQQRENLRDSVANALRAAVISGELVPGEVYSAPMLGARFGVSATPVREAMLDLVREGLVISLRNKGFRVTEMSDADLDNLASLRQLIEPPTIRDVVPVIPADDFPRLRALAEEIVVAAEAGDLIAYIEADRVFHVTLLAYSGNQKLVDVVSDLRSQTRLLGLTPLVESGRLVQSAAEHHELMDLVEARDAEGAEQAMRRHIGHVRGLWARNPED
ncbi:MULTISPECIES: GntR family transcriptional regulator [unclassified Kribbella]|uniref:GntR family transcriptional regulator n=1 Tax=unclassified Kribbella TaxID=2644121 RepID=UPI00301A9771